MKMRLTIVLLVSLILLWIAGSKLAHYQDVDALKVIREMQNLCTSDEQITKIVPRRELGNPNVISATAAGIRIEFPESVKFVQHSDSLELADMSWTVQVYYRLKRESEELRAWNLWESVLSRQFTRTVDLPSLSEDMLAEYALHLTKRASLLGKADRVIWADGEARFIVIIKAASVTGWLWPDSEEQGLYFKGEIGSMIDSESLIACLSKLKLKYESGVR
jgi:hypothetical protein